VEPNAQPNGDAVEFRPCGISTGILFRNQSSSRSSSRSLSILIFVAIFVPIRIDEDQDKDRDKDPLRRRS